jgi:uncharacterized protein YqeY
MLIETIEKEKLSARKARDTNKATLLSTLLGEILQIGKRENRVTTEDEAKAVIKKFVKDIDFVIEKGGSTTNLLSEKKILLTFLPPQLSQDDLKEILLKHFYIFNNKPAMKDIMKFLKENFEDQYNGREASTVANELIEKYK